MTTICQALYLVFVAKTARTFCYGFLGVLFPLYLSELGVSTAGVGTAVTLTLAGSAALTWGIRRPAERYGARPVLGGLAMLSGLAAFILLASRDPRLVVLAAMLGNLAVGTGETGPFLTLEQVLIARAVDARRRSARLIRRLAALGALDSFAGGFVLQSLVAYYLHARYGLGLEALGWVFGTTQILTAVSLLLAPRAARRFGLLVTMVVSPFVLGGGLKIVYDLLLYRAFRHIKEKLDA